MNNQFSGPNARGDYLTALEHPTPLIEAIAVTDYYVTDTYEEVLRHKAADRLPSTKLVFPNVELRLDVATAKSGFVNLHLFVSPEDPQHLDELRRLLSRLQFNVMHDRFDCTRADLIWLGKKADTNIPDERAALRRSLILAAEFGLDVRMVSYGAPSGRLVGDIGEVIAELEYDLTLHGVSQPTHDAITADNRNVQIKATFKDSLTFRKVPDYYWASSCFPTVGMRKFLTDLAGSFSNGTRRERI